MGRAPRLPRPGDYLTDGRNLYCVEELFEEHALIEDCRTGVLIDVSRRELLALARVKHEAGSGGEEPAGSDEPVATEEREPGTERPAA